MSAEIIPTVFVKEGEDFMSRFNKVVGISNFVQIDFMDGEFVKSKSTSLDDIPFLKDYDVMFEAHLMVKDPEEWVEKLSKKGFTNVVFHYEAADDDLDVKYIAGVVRRYHMNPIVCVNPSTPIEKVFGVLDVVNHVQLMGVEPGEEGQEFISDTIKRIKALKQYKRSIKVQVDGGINLSNAERVADAGCDFLNSGSLISNSDSPKATLMKLQAAVDDLSEDDGWE